MAGLTMGPADIAYSKEGIADLINLINTETKLAKAKMSPSTEEFVTLVNSLRTEWSGVDCESFINDLKRASTTLSDSLQESSNKLIYALNTYQNDFNKMQQTTYVANSVQIKK